MRRIYPEYTYTDAPRGGCWWDQTADLPPRPALAEDTSCDVAVIGAGFTGLSAALHLAQAGVSVCVLDSRHVGWGASGRNGGFCCLGGGMLDNAKLERSFGREGRQEWRQAEVDSIRLVEGLLERHDIDVDRHSEGETQVAHRARDYEQMQAEQAQVAETYGVEPRLTPPEAMADEGLQGGFHGALTIPIGFGLNPRKYVLGLARAAEDAGVRIFEHAAVSGVTRQAEQWTLTTDKGAVQADRVIVATNGYSSDDVPVWLSGRYMPTQSSIIVSRPLTQAELETQGWTSRQATYDTRRLLHYFRLMPDNRMLFGVRGGLMSSPRSDARARARARRDFDAMFPAWRHMETPHYWSGLVCIARNRMPFVGAVPQMPGVYASLCYHGNGVAMGSYCGALLSDLVQDKVPSRVYPRAVQRPLARFELGRFRRVVMPFAYARFALSDR